MIESYTFLKAILDTITDHIAVIDRQGGIVFVNRAWIIFAKQNNCPVTKEWDGMNYLEICDKSAAAGDEDGARSAAGIRRVITGRQDMFYLEYPCHSAEEKRWFMMRTSPLRTQASSYYVISHQNITERKLAEEAVLKLSFTDGLTDLANRRRFDDFLRSEWKRCARLHMPLTLVIIDIDNFKRINDTYGHQVGDTCLQVLGAALKERAKRPSDLCARLGGDEFAVVLGNTTLQTARVLAEKLVLSVRKLVIPDNSSRHDFHMTVSIGLSTAYPEKSGTEKELITAADTQLYFAKKKGKDQFAFQDSVRSP